MTTSIGRRVRPLNDRAYTSGPIVYWMSRDQRVHDNWALLAAQSWAKKEGVGFAVAHNLVPNFLGGGKRQWDFKVRGLEEVEKELRRFGIPFYLFTGKDSHKELAGWLKKRKVGGLIADFSPLRLARTWINEVLHLIHIPVHEVDTHNIVPCWIASPKQEFAARTIRPKIHLHLKEFLTDIPALKKQPHHAPFTYETNDWQAIRNLVKEDKEQAPITWIAPGEHAAKKALQAFLRDRLPMYADNRNDPNKQALSNLSPYYHYGHLSPQRAAWEVVNSDASKAARDAYAEELIVRRELSDNYCFYQPHYDQFKGLPAWAQKTLKDHRNDKREYVYTRKEFENANTHDALWNAAQEELKQTGKMHGYMRMYWAKKILEWTKTPEEAMRIAIELNDRYELDGRDSNGYVGVAWSIGGLHDRPWFERKVFGTVRYMNRSGCEKKFDVDAYIQRWLP